MKGDDRHIFRPVLPRYAGPVTDQWLLLHGWMQSGAYWAPAARWLALGGVRLLWADLGTLADSCTAGAGTLARTRQLVDRLVEGAARLGIGVAVGHSAGATVGVLAARRLPALRAVALVEPVAGHFGLAGTALTPPPGPGTRPQLESEDELRLRYPLAATSTLRTIRESMAGAEPPPVSNGPRPRMVDPARADACRAALAAVPVPLLVLRGEGSALLPAAAAAAIVAHAPAGAGCCVIQGAGHSPHVDDPRRTAAALLLLAQTRAGGRAT